MSHEYEKLMQKIADVIENRTISLPPRKVKEYEAGVYHPIFCLLLRDGELMCMWCSNRKDTDIEIMRIPRPDLGLFTDAKEPRSWHDITMAVAQHMNIKI